MLLGDANIEDPARESLLHRDETGRACHRCGNTDDAVVALGNV